jgi:hypothetical protein
MTTDLTKFKSRNGGQCLNFPNPEREILSCELGSVLLQLELGGAFPAHIFHRKEKHFELAVVLPDPAPELVRSPTGDS